MTSICIRLHQKFTDLLVSLGIAACSGHLSILQLVHCDPMAAKYFVDPLDSEEFDSVQYINQRFPTENSLDDLDSFIVDIGSQISTLDEEISKAVQTQSVIGKQASKDILETQGSINDLFQKISDIKLKASQSEKMVQEICADIKKLDYAKNHLQTSITSLNRLQMLISAVGQLEMLANQRSYREVANLLDAVKQFMTHFDKYVHIPVVQSIDQRIKAIRVNLTNQISDIFSKLAEAVDKVADGELDLGLPGGVRALTDSCLVVDSLGAGARKQLLSQFVTQQLIPYDNLFGQGREHFQLDQVERRWSWFKRLLKYVDGKFGHIFPAHWRLPLRLCLEFCERTKMHLITLLTEMESSNRTDVHTLLKALQSAIRFETEMSERFNLLQELQQSKDQEAALAKQALEDAALQNRLKKDDKLMYLPVDHTALNKTDETESGFLTLAHASILGGISGVFDHYLGSYVVLEKQNLEDMLHRLSSEEDTTSEGVGMGNAGSTFGNVYGSSTSMFVFIKNSIKRCTALTTGKTFLSLSKEFKTCMLQYIELLMNRCPPAVSLGSSNLVTYKLPPNGEVSMCYLINTGEYCAEVVPQLEQMIQQKMQPSLSSKVSFDTEVDAFMDLVAHCIKVLVAGVMDRLDPSFKTMAAINWAGFTQVGEESAYLHTCNAVLVDAIPKIRDSLSASYFNNLCNKISSEILQRYLDVIVKQKHISEMATQQLLLDTYNMKAVLTQLPNLSSDGAAAAPHKAPNSMYLKLVNNKIAHIEMILKLVGTPEDMLLERFRIMWPDGQPADLQLLMALKGTKRNDQQVILEMLGLSAAGKMLNKTAHTIFAAGSSAAGGGGSAAAADGSASAQPTGSSSYSAASAAAASASALASSTMKSLTLDISSSARSAVGNLKWATNTQNRGFEEAYKTEQFQEWMLQFNAMQLSKREIKKLYYIFKKVDVDGSGSIGLAELLTHIDLERTRFTERIFSIFDEDGSGEIDFREFVLSLWNYCTLTKATLDMFAFDLYDKDSSGELSAYEVTRMLQDIYGKKEAKNNFLAKTVAADLKAIEAEGDLLNIEAFRNFVKTHQALLFPAFQMQLALQRRTLGQRFWARNAEKRLKFSNGKYISVGNFILFNVDAKKKTLLSSDAPEAVAMHGARHMDDDVGKLMEVAGTKAARRNTVMLNERRSSFVGNAPGMSEQQLFSIKNKALFDPNQPMNESNKKAWLNSILTLPTLFSKGESAANFSASLGSTKSFKKTTSAKNPKQIQVSQKIAPAPSGPSGGASNGAYASNNEGSGKPRKNSKENVPNVYDIHANSTGNSGRDPRDRPRKLSKEKDGIVQAPNNNNTSSTNATTAAASANALGIAAVDRTEKSDPHSHNSIHARENREKENVIINKETSKHKKKDEIPSGRVKNPGLTMNAIKAIDAASPIEAWSSQPVESRKLNMTSFGSVKEQNNSNSGNYNGNNNSNKSTGGGAGSGGGGGGGTSGFSVSGKVNANVSAASSGNYNNASAKAAKASSNKYSTNVDLFEVESVEDDKNDYSSSKKAARRSSLSKYDHSASGAHNNSTFTDYSHLTSPGNSAASIKVGSSKRVK